MMKNGKNFSSADAKLYIDIYIHMIQDTVIRKKLALALDAFGDESVREDCLSDP